MLLPQQMENKSFYCQCGNLEHQVVISFTNEKTWNDLVFINVHLSQVKFLDRLKYALKYIFGISQSDSGAYDEILFNKKDLNLFISNLNDIYIKMEEN